MIRLEAPGTFVEGAEHGNIKDGAEKRRRTPSALSMTLKQIEDRLGHALFETDRKYSLTEMGRYLLATGETFLRDYDHVVELVCRAESAIARRPAPLD